MSRYLLTVTVINILLGLATTCAMWMLGVENPILWGVFVAVMNYIPYLGPIVAFVFLGIMAIATFESPIEMIWPPLAFLAINTAEAYWITPRVLGNRLDLNPVLLLISLAFWGFIWGIPGMLIAVPVLVVIKLVCDHFESMAAVNEFLGGAAMQPVNRSDPAAGGLPTPR